MTMLDDYTDASYLDGQGEEEDAYDAYDEHADDDETYAEDDDSDAEFLPFLPFPGLPNPFGRRPAPPRAAPPPVPTAVAKGYYQRPVSKQYVTHGQLKSSLARVQQDVRRNAAGVKTLTGQVRATRAQLTQQAATNRKQSQRIEKLAGRVDQQAQTALLMSLLEDDKANYKLVSATVAPDAPAGTSDVARRLVGTTVQLEKESDGFTKMLPILLSGGLGGSGESKGGLFGDPMTAMALVLAMK